MFFCKQVRSTFNTNILYECPFIIVIKNDNYVLVCDKNKSQDVKKITSQINHSKEKVQKINILKNQTINLTGHLYILDGIIKIDNKTYHTKEYIDVDHQNIIGIEDSYLVLIDVLNDIYEV